MLSLRLISFSSCLVAFAQPLRTPSNQFSPPSLLHHNLTHSVSYSHNRSSSQISEVTPRGKEYLFFSLFSIVGKTSSFLGPIISSAIVDASTSSSSSSSTADPPNNNTPFYFLTAISVLSFAGLWWYLDLDESRREQERFLREEARVRRVLRLKEEEEEEGEEERRLRERLMDEGEGSYRSGSELGDG